ncbi:MAG: ABC transporter permease [Streptosporangiaceae bacterium]
MPQYLLRRTATLVPLLLVVSFIVFSLLYIAPGTPEQLLVGDHVVTPQTLAAIRQEYGLNHPFIVQYVTWLGHLVRGNLGISVQNNEPVLQVIRGPAAVSLELAVMATALVILAGFLIGLLAGTMKDTWVDRIASAGVLVGASLSTYLSGILLIVALAVGVHWFPVFGAGSGVLDRLYHLILPALALAIALTASVARVMRASVIEIVDQEFIMRARSEGLPTHIVFGKHALRSAAIPAVTMSGLILAGLIGGSILVEYTFGLGGLGSLLVSSINVKDFAVVQTIALLYTAVFIIGNLVTDVICAIVDPRMRLFQGASRD